MPPSFRQSREKVFGPGRAVPLDRNAKVRIQAYARAWSTKHRQPRQHRGPITRAFLEVLEALLWGFHNSQNGCCFPSHKAIAVKAECCRDTVAEALKVLEWAGILTWQHRIARIRVRELDLFGHFTMRWRVIRTSNAYVFLDPLRQRAAAPPCKSEIRTGTPNQDSFDYTLPKPTDPDSPLERALRRLGIRVAGNGNEKGGQMIAPPQNPLKTVHARVKDLTRALSRACQNALPSTSAAPPMSRPPATRSVN